METSLKPLLPKTGEAIKVLCPALGIFSERELLLCYDKDNFIFNIYAEYFKVGTTSERDALSNIENGLYVIVQEKVNAPYLPSKREIHYWVKETMDYWNLTFIENRPPKLRQLQENLKRMEEQLKEKTNDSFYESFPIGEANRELKIKYEATKIVLKKIQKENIN